MGLIKCPECGKEVSDQAASCPNCGHPIAQPAPRPKAPAAGPEKKTGNLGCLGWAFIIGVIVILYGIINSPDVPDAPGGSSYSGPSHDAGMAWTMSKDFVTKRLSAPSTAEFPWYSEIESGITQNGREYTIEAYVDAQNGFGAQIRQEFTVKVRYDGGETWSLIDINFK